MTAPPTHYELLGADRGSSQEELRALWQRLARLLHPDRHVLKAAEEQRRASAAFAELSHAYGVLSDPAARRAYDRHLRLSGAECRKCGGAGRTYSGRSPTAMVAAVCPACRGNGYVSHLEGGKA